MTLGVTGIHSTPINYTTPATGFSMTLMDTDWYVLIEPAGTLATGTIEMSLHPLDGQIINIRTTKQITSITILPNSGQSVNNAPSILYEGVDIDAIYRAANTTWYFTSPSFVPTSTSPPQNFILFR